MAKKSKQKKAVKARTGTIREFVSPLIKDASLTIDQIVAKVKAKFPKSKFQETHVYWYRQHLSSEGAKIHPLPNGDRKPRAAKAEKKAGKKKATKAGKKATTRRIPSTPAALAQQQASA